MNVDDHDQLMEQWKTRIQERVNSGKSVKTWCAENDILPSRYFYWLKRLRAAHFDDKVPELRTQHPSSCVSNTTSASSQPTESGTFVELRRPQPDVSPSHLSNTTPAAVIRVNGIEAAIFQDTTELFIRQLLSVIRDA